VEAEGYHRIGARFASSVIDDPRTYSLTTAYAQVERQRHGEASGDALQADEVHPADIEDSPFAPEGFSANGGGLALAPGRSSVPAALSIRPAATFASATEEATEPLLGSRDELVVAADSTI